TGSPILKTGRTAIALAAGERALRGPEGPTHLAAHGARHASIVSTCTFVARGGTTNIKCRRAVRDNRGNFEPNRLSSNCHRCLHTLDVRTASYPGARSRRIAPPRPAETIGQTGRPAGAAHRGFERGG